MSSVFPQIISFFSAVHLNQFMSIGLQMGKNVEMLGLIQPAE